MITMRSVAVTCVKNEIDIVEAFTRHTLALVDHLVVLDSGSQDGTVDVLHALAKEGLPLEIMEDGSPGQYQPQRMTRLMHEHAVARHDADWVFPLDGDEFLMVSAGSSLIPEGAAADRPMLLAWRTYVPDNSDNPCELNPVLRIRRRRVVEGPEFAKAILLAASLTEDQQWSVQQQAALVADLYARFEEQRKEREYLRAINYAVSVQQGNERASLAKELAELRQCRTWKIGRLFVGPVAWARRSGKRCSRALARTLLRTRPAPVPIGNLELHVAHGCNLSCESCSHYTSQGHRSKVGRRSKLLKAFPQSTMESIKAYGKRRWHSLPKLGR
jgi:hypothetical protein